VIDVADFAVDSLATVPGAIRSGQKSRQLPAQPAKEAKGGDGHWIDELSNGLLLNR
jgi:hypothetical protein